MKKLVAFLVCFLLVFTVVQPAFAAERVEVPETEIQPSTGQEEPAPDNPVSPPNEEESASINT